MPIELKRGTPAGQGSTRYRVVASAKTDAEGRYRMTGLLVGDKYHVTAKPSFPAYAPGWLHGSPYVQEVPIDQEGDYDLGDMKLVELGQALSGRVVDPDGNPVEGVSVERQKWRMVEI